MRQPQEHQQCQNQQTFLHLLTQPVRVVLINEILSFQLPLRFCLMYIPMFSQFWRMYMTGKQQLMQIIYGGMNMMNTVLQCCPNFVRQLFGGMGIFFFMFLYQSHNHILNSLIPNMKQPEDWMAYYLDILRYPMWVGFLLCFFSQPGTIAHNWTDDQLKKLQNHRLEFTTSRCLCLKCQKPKVARSVHCDMCNTCTARFSEHCDITNHCIGAKNYVQYLVFIFTTSVYIVYSFNLFMKPLQKDYRAGMSNLLLTIGLLYLIKTFVTKSLQHFNLIFHNMTLHEVQKWQQIPYFWKNQYREFYNHFDKGVCYNFVELIVPLLQGEVTQEETGSKKPYQQLDADVEMNTMGEDDDEEYVEVEDLELYKGKYINWLNAKYYTVMDIRGDHPMKQKTYDELKKRGVMNENANNEKEMKQSWKKYMKETMRQQKQQYDMQQQAQATFRRNQQACHDSNCKTQHENHPESHNHMQRQFEAFEKQQAQQHLAGNQSSGSVDISQKEYKDPQKMNQAEMDEFRQDTHNELREMMQKRMEMMKQQQKMMQMESQEESGLLNQDDHDD